MHLYTPVKQPLHVGSIHESERERKRSGDWMAPAQQPAEDLEKEKRPGGSPAWVRVGGARVGLLYSVRRRVLGRHLA